MIDHYSTGGYIPFKIQPKTSKNKPKAVARALFRALWNMGPIQKKKLNEMFTYVTGMEGKVNIHGYCDSTIAWHTRAGRLKRERVGNKTHFSLTIEGIKYAKERGIL